MTDDRKEQFTPGPWEVAETDDGLLHICGDDRTMIVGSVQGRRIYAVRQFAANEGLQYRRGGFTACFVPEVM